MTNYPYPFYTSGTTTNTYQTLTITGAQTIYGPNAARIAENAMIPDTAEQWLRRRVKEVCELAAA